MYKTVTSASASIATIKADALLKRYSSLQGGAEAPSLERKMSVNPDVRLDQMGTLEVLVKRANNLVAKDTADRDLRLQNVACQFEAKMWHEADSEHDYRSKIEEKIVALTKQMPAHAPAQAATHSTMPPPPLVFTAVLQTA